MRRRLRHGAAAAVVVVVVVFAAVARVNRLVHRVTTATGRGRRRISSQHLPANQRAHLSPFTYSTVTTRSTLLIRQTM